MKLNRKRFVRQSPQNPQWQTDIRRYGSVPRVAGGGVGVVAGGLSRSFGDRVALDDVSLTIEAGRAFGAAAFGAAGGGVGWVAGGWAAGGAAGMAPG